VHKPLLLTHHQMVSKPRYSAITKFALHASNLHVKIHLHCCPPDRKYQDLLSFSITFSGFGANPAVLRQFNAPLIILEVVWELCMVTTALLIQWEVTSQHDVNPH